MNITNSTISRKNNFSPVFGHENFNSDYILPDYFPEINKIIRCSIQPSTEEITISNGKSSISGIVSFNILYLSDENKIISYGNTFKYTKVFQSDIFKEGICVDAKQEIISENIRATGPKRFNISGTIELKLCISNVELCEYITSINESNVESATEKIKLFDFSYNNYSSFSSKETLKLNADENIVSIIRNECNFIIKDKKVIKGKIYLNGEYVIRLIYLTDTCTVKVFTASVPVSEVVDCAGTKEDDLCFISDISCNTNAEIVNNTEENLINIEFKTSFILTTGQYTDACIITDTYGIDRDINAESRVIDLTDNITNNNKIINVSIEYETSEKISQILDFCADSITVSFEKNNERNAMIVDIKYKLLTINDADEIISVSDKYSYEYLLDPSDKIEYIQSQINLLSSKALQVDNGKVHLNLELGINYIEVTTRKANLITAVKFDDSLKYCSNCGIVLYFAEKDESIWDIAKSNKTTVKEICLVNNISEKILTEDTLLILPKI